MMENPFLGNYWNGSRPRYSATPLEIPILRQQTKPSTPPKVVSIPVDFVGSEKSRSAATIKIQKVFRGFTVRKNVKKICGIGREVDEIQRRISQNETAELMRRDAKERLKVNETLMALLIRLDSVRGVDSGVRDFLKAVIRRVIALQEAVDAIVAVESADLERENEADADSNGMKDESEENMENSNSAGNSDMMLEETEFTVDKNIETEKAIESADSCEKISDAVSQKLEIQNQGRTSADSCEALSNAVDQSVEMQGSCDEETPPQPHSAEYTDKIQKEEDIVVDPMEETPENGVQAPSEEKMINEMSNQVESTEIPQSSIEDDEREDRETQDAMVVQRSEETTRVNDVGMDMVQKMIEENEKLKRLFSELCERNIVQCRMVSALTQRVEQLERLVARTERSKMKKKKRLEMVTDGRRL